MAFIYVYIYASFINVNFTHISQSVITRELFTCQIDYQSFKTHLFIPRNERSAVQSTDG